MKDEVEFSFFLRQGILRHGHKNAECLDRIRFHSQNHRLMIGISDADNRHDGARQTFGRNAIRFRLMRFVENFEGIGIANRSVREQNGQRVAVVQNVEIYRRSRGQRVKHDMLCIVLEV